LLDDGLIDRVPRQLMSGAREAAVYVVECDGPDGPEAAAP
jgi:hypothetical protein